MQENRDNVVCLLVVARPRPLPEPANDNDPDGYWPGFSAETIHAGDRPYEPVCVSDEEFDAMERAEAEACSCPDLWGGTFTYSETDIQEKTQLEPL